MQRLKPKPIPFPQSEKDKLLRFLAVRLRKDRSETRPRNYSKEVMTAMIAEDKADGERFRRAR